MPTVDSFLSGSVTASSFSVPALRVKASALFARADQIANSWGASKPILILSFKIAVSYAHSVEKMSSNIDEEIRTLEHAITLYVSTLMPMDQLDVVLPDERHSLIMDHTLAQCAIIYLYRPFALDDAMAFDKSSRASRACISIIKHISDQDFPFLEPIIGVSFYQTPSFCRSLLISVLPPFQPCWWSVADIIIRDLDTLENSWPLVDHSETRNELSILLYAMSSLSNRFPVVGRRYHDLRYASYILSSL